MIALLIPSGAWYTLCDVIDVGGKIMEETTAQVLAVTGKQTRAGTMYEAKLSDGKTYGIWEAELAAKANALQGQTVIARFETTQKPGNNGRVYTNHTIKEIGLPGTLGAVAQPAVPGTPVPALPPVTGATAGAVAAIPMQAPPFPEEERQKLIVRQNVLGTSFEFVGRIYEGAGPEALDAAKDTALSIASELYAKVFASPVAPPPATPVEVAAQVNAASETGAEVTVGPTPEW